MAVIYAPQQPNAIDKGMSGFTSGVSIANMFQGIKANKLQMETERLQQEREKAFMSQIFPNQSKSALYDALTAERSFNWATQDRESDLAYKDAIKRSAVAEANLKEIELKDYPNDKERSIAQVNAQLKLTEASTDASKAAAERERFISSKSTYDSVLESAASSIDMFKVGASTASLHQNSDRVALMEDSIKSTIDTGVIQAMDAWTKMHPKASPEAISQQTSLIRNLLTSRAYNLTTIESDALKTANDMQRTGQASTNKWFKDTTGVESLYTPDELKMQNTMLRMLSINPSMSGEALQAGVETMKRASKGEDISNISSPIIPEKSMTAAEAGKQWYALQPRERMNIQKDPTENFNWFSTTGEEKPLLVNKGVRDPLGIGEEKMTFTQAMNAYNKGEVKASEMWDKFAPYLMRNGWDYDEKTKKLVKVSPNVQTSPAVQTRGTGYSIPK